MSETIQNTVARITAFVAQNFTDIETGPGSVINELLIKLAATIQNEQNNLITSLSQSAAIASVQNSTEDSFSEIIDKVASNYNTTRSGGTKARGKVRVTVSSSGEYTFREGYTFVQAALNLNFVVLKDTLVSPNPSAILEEIQLYADQGLYYFVLDVEAENVGADYQLPSGTVFSIPEKYYLRDFVKAEAYGNFSTGAAPETDKQLLAKVKNNIGNSRLESESGIRNKFRDTFPSFQALSVCGANDAEMLRSKQNLLGISTFGKADVYVRSSLGLETRQVLKQGTLIDPSENLWQVILANSDAPGFYYIQSVIPKVTDISIGGTLVIRDTDYSYSTYYNQRNNEISSAAEARFTKYQNAIVTFTYQAPVGVTSLLFELHVLGQPNILEMQDLLLIDSQRLACADYLVKAVVPCLVSLNINLIKKNPIDTYTSLNLQQLKKDIFNYVNTIPFGEQLYASNIVNLCHNYNIKHVDLPIEMAGQVLAPDGTVTYVTSNDALIIPYNLSAGVSPKTSGYFIDYYRTENGKVQPVDNIGINIS
jgi:hypothetical protein